MFKFLDHGILGGTTLFVLGKGYDETIDFLKPKKFSEWRFALADDKELLDNAEWACLSRSIENVKDGSITKCFFIFVKNFDFSDLHYCALAHEITHLMQFMCKDFFDRNKEIEFEAYLHTHIMKQCLAAIREHQKGNKSDNK